MSLEILLNNKKINFKTEDLPCLVAYKHGEGGSHLSVTMMADLFLSGAKILFLTAYPMAKDNFLEQVGEKEKDVLYLEDEEDLDENYQGIIIESGNEALFCRVFEKLRDIGERVVFIKNMEVFSSKAIDFCLGLEKLFLSGDIDETANKEQISQKNYSTLISFSKTKTPLPIEIPKLEKYQGYFKGKNKEGVITVKM